MERVKFAIKPSFVLFCLFVIVLGKTYVFVVYVVSVLIHELAHLFVAEKYYYRCTQIALSVFGAALYGEFEEAQGSEQIKIALAGPLVNLVIAIIGVSLWYVLPESYLYTKELVLCNLTLGATNLIPCYPLDGGKILVGVLSRKHGYASSVRLTKRLSLVLSITFFLVFCCTLFLQTKLYTLALFAVFLLMSSLVKIDQRIYSRASVLMHCHKRVNYGIEKKTIVFSQQATLSAAMKKIERNTVYDIEIVDKDFNTVRRLSEKEFADLILNNSIDKHFSQVI